MYAPTQAAYVSSTSIQAPNMRPNTPQDQNYHSVNYHTPHADSPSKYVGLQKLINTYSRRVLKDSLCKPNQTSFVSPIPYRESDDTVHLEGREHAHASGLQSRSVTSMDSNKKVQFADSIQTLIGGRSVYCEDGQFYGQMQRSCLPTVSVPPAFYSLTALQSSRSSQALPVVSAPRGLRLSDAALEFKSPPGNKLYVGIPVEISSLSHRDTCGLSPRSVGSNALAASRNKGHRQRRVHMKKPTAVTASTQSNKQDSNYRLRTIALPLI